MTSVRTFLPLLAGVFSFVSLTIANAHPHVFAEARLEVVSNAEGEIQRLQNVWRFDELFTATVIFEFDLDGDNQLNEDEASELAKVITESLADYDYFLEVKTDDGNVSVQPVTDMRTMFDGPQMILFFTAKPSETVILADAPQISVYDPTFYTSIEFYEDDAMEIQGGPSTCEHDMVIPDIEAILAQSQDTLTEEFFNDPAGNDYSRMFATRMEISCAAG
ncbi:MAG: DUF1007 family protein [Pseudomonadota bacterium]